MRYSNEDFAYVLIPEASDHWIILLLLLHHIATISAIGNVSPLPRKDKKKNDSTPFVGIDGDKRETPHLTRSLGERSHFRAMARMHAIENFIA